uniref:Sushi domain-containing protein n=1 Tax=Taeniopygia guttata TaxID=59729 RepID=A0A674GT48_TAEGU
EARCQPGGTWDPPVFPPPCAEVTCPRPPSIANGLPSGHPSGSFSRGVTVSYSCRPGFELLGNASVTCADSGLWSRPLPRCQGVWVPLPGRGAGRGPGVLEGRSRGVSWNQFMPSLPAPVVMCFLLPQLLLQVGGHGLLSAPGQTVTFRCHDGYSLQGSASVSCQEDGSWQPPAPVCIPCEPPPDIPHGQHSGRLLSEFHYGTAVSYSCQPGFPLHGHPSIHCTTRDGYSGVWSEPLPACGESSCPVPQIQHGRIVAARSAYSHRDTVTFECEPGYAIRGHREIQCQPNNTWEPPVPVCEQGKCPSRASPSPAPQIHLLCLFNAGLSLSWQLAAEPRPGWALPS